MRRFASEYHVQNPIAAGVAALTSAFPQWQLNPVHLSLGFVALLMLGNLRGLRESGRIFSIPTYLFIGSVGVMIVVGLARTLFPVGVRSVGPDVAHPTTIGDLKLVPVPPVRPETIVPANGPNVVMVVFESTRADVLGKRIDGKPVGNGAPGLIASALRRDFHQFAEQS